MDFSRKIFFAGFIFFVVLFLPVATFAETRDYLFVSAEFSNDSFANVGVDEYAMDSAKERIYKSGTYEIRLYDGVQMIGGNFFEISDIQGAETIGIADKDSGARFYGTYKPVFQIVQVALPLTKSVNPENASIKILRDERVLFDKKISELTFNVISANTNRLLVDTPPPPPLPPPQNTSGGRVALVWLILALVLGGGVFALYKTGKLRPKDDSKPL